ncbi:MAG: hypothetical protein KHY88_07110 [Erysipelotrichaceae bacterium]|nr:hypothetical protein [Erysipelotrichaceae bacterium]
MKSKKRLTYITLIVSVLSLIVAFCVGKKANSIYYDIALAFLGSAALGFIMSITEYYVEKRKSMEEFWIQATKLLKELSTIKYLDIDAPIDLIINCLNEEGNNEYNKFNIKSFDTKDSQTQKDKLIKWFKENNFTIIDNEVNSNDWWDKYYSSKMNEYRVIFDTQMDKYRKLTLLDTGLLDNAYGNLDFMFVNKCLRNKLCFDIYQNIRDIIFEINSQVCHFNLLKSGDGNYAVCVLKLKELNNLFLM